MKQKLKENLFKVCQFDILGMTYVANSGHPGGSLSSLPLLFAAFHNIDNVRKMDINKTDMIVISNGHITPAYYSMLCRVYNEFDKETMYLEYRNFGLEGHISKEMPGVLWSTGSLGQGLSAAVGFAYYKKINNKPGKVFCICGDGELQKGQIFEALNFAEKHKLNNLIILVDYNKKQITGDLVYDNIMDRFSDIVHIYSPVTNKGFVHIVNNLVTFINQCFENKNKLPSIILFKSKMGFGIPFMEDKHEYHGKPVSRLGLDSAVTYLFKVREVQTEALKFVDRIKELRSEYIPDMIESKQKPINLDLTNALTKFKKPKRKNIDMRKALEEHLYATIIKDTKHEYFIFDCDLAPSVGLQKLSKSRSSHIHFIEMGISEHHTATMAGAISTIDNVISIWADFGVFGLDEVYNQLRMINNTENTNLKLFLTHTGINVGEDGKSHHCIDYLNLICNLKNFRTFIPADAIHLKAITSFVLKNPGNYIVIIPRSADTILDYDKTLVFGSNLVMSSNTLPMVSIITTSHVLKECMKTYETISKYVPTDLILITETKNPVDPGLIERISESYNFLVLDHITPNIIELDLRQKLKKLHSIGIERTSFSAERSRLYNFHGMSSKKLTDTILKTLMEDVKQNYKRKLQLLTD